MNCIEIDQMRPVHSDEVCRQKGQHLLQRSIIQNRFATHQSYLGIIARSLDSENFFAIYNPRSASGADQKLDCPGQAFLDYSWPANHCKQWNYGRVQVLIKEQVLVQTQAE